MSILSLLGGLAMFLFGMNVMGLALEKQAGGRFKGVLERVTSNPLSGVLLGTAITAVIQSSSATTVMVVGFVNAGIMTLENSIGIIMGANIGTSVTAWILSLTGIESSNIFISLLKPANFSPVVAAIGVSMIVFSKSEKKKDAGNIMMGFALLMFGMEAMSNAAKPLASIPEFTELLLLFRNPVMGVFMGIIVTATIQSSSASVGILQAISLTGSLNCASALPIIMGQNIGTCVTALLSSAGTSANAKRAALIHLYFNVVGTIVFLAVFYLLDAIIGFSFLDSVVTPLYIAIIHTVFNLFNTAVLLPFRRSLVWMASFSVKEDPAEKKFERLDERFLATPSFAASQCRELAINMAELSRQTLLDAINLLDGYNETAARRILEAENEADLYEDRLGTYMVKLSGKSMPVNDSREVSKLLHCIGDFERISDHAVNIMRTSEELYQKNIQFSRPACGDLKIMQSAVCEIVDMAISSFKDNDLIAAGRVEPLEQVIDMLKNQLKARHIARLQKGECTTILGFVFSDLITNYERIADHCSNIAVAVIQIKHDSFDTHQYLSALKSPDNEEFSKLYSDYLEKYRLIY